MSELTGLLHWLETHLGAPVGGAGEAPSAAADGLIAMVVEGHDFQRRTVARMLRALGARQVLEASDGSQAITLIGDTLPAVIDVVVCDLDMPNMDGMEFIRHFGEAKHMASVIICSAKDRALLSSVEQMARAYGVTVLGVIEKPVTRAALGSLIGRHATPKSVSQTQKIILDTPVFRLDEILRGMDTQFEPFFQPKVQMSTGKVVGAEALARWRHPEHGIIAPYAFIAPLELGGHINALTFIMLEKAAVACRKWRAAGIECNVSVNLSLSSLSDTTLADQITDAVRGSGLASNDMTLEVTETIAMTDVAPALENLTRLRMRGFGLSIDDYGTGFSSMQQLSRIPFTELKIDQSFVRGCACNNVLRPIVESSVEMARRLHLKSVAEGVETQEDWDVLKAVGCDLVQGYFIARPMDEGAFTKFCRAHADGAVLARH